MTAPCHECTRRTAIPNCHANCEQYQAYSVEREMIRVRRQRVKTGDDALIAHAEKRKINTFKQRRR